MQVPETMCVLMSTHLEFQLSILDLFFPLKQKCNRNKILPLLKLTITLSKEPQLCSFLYLYNKQSKGTEGGVIHTFKDLIALLHTMRQTTNMPTVKHAREKHC